MNNENTNKLEKRLIEIFGEKATLAVTNARIGKEKYMTRIEACGVPFKIDVLKSSNEESEQLALSEFNKHLDEALQERLLPTQTEDCYEIVKLSEEELNKLYKFEEFFDEDYFKEIKEKTTAKICQLENGKYECVISSPYMNLNSRCTANSKKAAIFIAIWTAHDVLKPSSIKVGDWPFLH